MVYNYDLHFTDEEMRQREVSVLASIHQAQVARLGGMWTLGISSYTLLCPQDKDYSYLQFIYGKFRLSKGKPWAQGPSRELDKQLDL